MWNFHEKPLTVVWESTIACELACRHCRAVAVPNRSPKELSTEEAMRLIDDLKNFKRPYPLLIISGGDCLVRDDLYNIIKYARDNGIRVAVAPTTTSNLSRKTISKLKESGASMVSISIDAPSAEAHDEFRGVKGTFDISLRAARYLKELNLPFQVNTTVTRFNYELLPEMFGLVSKLGAIRWDVFLLVPVGRARYEYGISPSECEDLYHFLYDCQQYGLLHIKTTEGQAYRRVIIQRNRDNLIPKSENYMKLREKLKKILGEPRREIKVPVPSVPTNDGKGFIFVSHEGQVYPSGFLPIKVGDVRERSLVDIYRESPILRELRNPELLKGKCGHCEFKGICGGSRARAYAYFKDYLAEDPYCLYRPAGA